MSNFLFGMFLFGVMVLFVACKSESQKDFDTNCKEITSFRYLYKVEFENHTYIFLRNTMNSAGDKLLHDPSCKCKKKE